MPVTQVCLFITELIYLLTCVLVVQTVSLESNCSILRRPVSSAAGSDTEALPVSSLDCHRFSGFLRQTDLKSQLAVTDESLDDV